MLVVPIGLGLAGTWLGLARCICTLQTQTEAPLSDTPTLLWMLSPTAFIVHGYYTMHWRGHWCNTRGFFVDIITFCSFRRCLVAYKYTMQAMLQARHTPIETVNTAGSMIPTISSMVTTVNALFLVYIACLDPSGSPTLSKIACTHVPRKPCSRPTPHQLREINRILGLHRLLKV